jgi:hypothetical protein
MEKLKFLSIHGSLIVILGFVFFACSPNATLPDPQMASGVYVHSGFEFYRWEEGLRLMIWHDGVNPLSCSSSTNGYYEVECHGVSISNHTIAWRLETNDGKTAQFTIDDHPFDLGEGSLFIITSSSEDTEVRQLMRDLSEVQAKAEDVTEFGLSDPAIHEFIQISFEIKDCISDCVSSSTTPEDRSDAPDVESAQQALVAFFSYLHEGEYEKASALYGGGYEIMRNHNPSIDPDDLVALFKNACTVNGAQCLEVHQSALLDRSSPAEFRFLVEFSNEDGAIFTLGTCCGSEGPSSIEQTEFIYTVRFECTGKYFVIDTPVYLP